MNKGMIITIFCTLAITIISTNAFAVDGYKNLKFGMSIEEVLKAGKELCSFQKIQEKDQISMYGCTDFKFAGEETKLYTYFVKGILLRVAVDVPVEKIDAIMNSLSKKYTVVANKIPSQGRFKKLDTHPNQQVDIFFENSTIIVRMMTDENINQSVLLIYTDPNFHKEVDKLNEKEVESDI